MTVVGWYHSHPVFPPNPSGIDVDNQRNYQALFRDAASGAEPFVGFIVGPYDLRLPTPSSKVQTFVSRKLAGEDKPFELDYSVLPEAPGEETLGALRKARNAPPPPPRNRRRSRAGAGAALCLCPVSCALCLMPSPRLRALWRRVVILLLPGSWIVVPTQLVDQYSKADGRIHPCELWRPFTTFQASSLGGHSSTPAPDTALLLGNQADAAWRTLPDHLRCAWPRVHVTLGDVVRGKACCVR